MSDRDFLAAYWQWLAVAGVVVLVVAALLIWILVIARRIAATAARALAAVEQIRDRTRAIPALQETNRLAEGLLAGARSIRAKAEDVADTVEGHAAPAAADRS